MTLPISFEHDYYYRTLPHTRHTSEREARFLVRPPVLTLLQWKRTSLLGLGCIGYDYEARRPVSIQSNWGVIPLRDEDHEDHRTWTP